MLGCSNSFGLAAVGLVAAGTIVEHSVACPYLLARYVILELFPILYNKITLPSRNRSPGSFFIIVIRYPGFRYKIFPANYNYFKYGSSANFSISKNSVILLEFAKRCCNLKSF